MNIGVLLKHKEDIEKHSYNFKPAEKNGMVLQVHHTVRIDKKEHRIRFIHTSFNDNGLLLAASDQAGNIFLVDFINNKYWILPNFQSCTTLKFSNYSNYELIIATYPGKLYLININTGEITGELISHKDPVTQISFSSDFQCLTSSNTEAILWDLRTNAKIQVLSIKPEMQLKHVLFMPVSNNILTIFNDDSILIWKHNTLELYKKIQSNLWQKNINRSIAFTRNGRAMIFSGYSPKLIIYMLDTWTVARSVLFPDCIRAVKKIAFLPQLFDGGANRVLAILATSGIMYFYDMEENVIINQIATQQEIVKFDYSSNGKYIACVLGLGEINIYQVSQFIPSYGGSRTSTVSSKKSALSASTRRSSSLLCVIQKQIKDVLDVDKLRSILKEYGRYPDSYRLKIWSQLLELPNNTQQYNAFINHHSHIAFENLTEQYPLENKLALKNLKKLLSNIVTWSPNFSQVSYLPVFVFPFVKVFQNAPILCFEAMCTIILNWCQYWFEYFPLPPLNILAIIENILQEHDNELLEHLTVYNITSKQYAWTLMEAAFSEILPPNDWCRLWDHILSNEPAFFLFVPVAYNIIHRKAILAMTAQDELDTFYHNHNIIDTKRFISKTYSLFTNTRKENHPSRYLKQFRKLEVDTYPVYNGFPKTLIDFDFNEIDNLKLEEELIQREEQEILQDIQDEKNNMFLLKKEEEEAERLKLLEQACKLKISDERDRIKEQRKRLVNLRRRLHHEELELLNKSRQTIIEKNSKDRQWALEKILNDIEQSKAAEELEVMKVESDLIKHYSELLHHKLYLEEQLNTDQDITQSSREHKILKRHQQKLNEELEKIKSESKSKVYLQHLNITTGLAAMDNLILRIEMELAKQLGWKCENVLKTNSNLKVIRLEEEVKGVESQVSNMLKLLAKLKSRETKEKFSELCGTVIDKSGLLNSKESHYSRQQKSHEFKENLSNMSNFSGDLGKLRKLLTETRDGYMARPSSPTSATGSSTELLVINANK